MYHTVASSGSFNKTGTVCPFKVPERSKFSLIIYDHFKALNGLDHSLKYHLYTLEFVVNVFST